MNLVWGMTDVKIEKKPILYFKLDTCYIFKNYSRVKIDIRSSANNNIVHHRIINVVSGVVAGGGGAVGARDTVPPATRNQEVPKAIQLLKGAPKLRGKQI